MGELHPAFGPRGPRLVLLRRLYPPGMQQRDYLTYYGTQFKTVEGTEYQTAKGLAFWSDTSPSINQFL